MVFVDPRPFTAWKRLAVCEEMTALGANMPDGITRGLRFA
jgi:hypothetical protein